MKTENKESFRVDVERVIRTQKNKFVKNLPGFAVNYLKKVLREKELNEINSYACSSAGIDYVNKCLEVMNITCQTFGTENLKNKGRYIFACNHPLGGIDFFAAISTIGKYHKKIKVIANEILMNVQPIKDMFLPVNVFGKNSEKDKEMIIKMMAADNIQLMTFPAGLVARKFNGTLDDGIWHRSFIRHSINFKRDIIPVFIDAENSKKFYNFSKFRKRIGIGLNLELFLLPQELVKKRNSKIDVIYGKPISYKSLDHSKTHLDWAQEVKKTVYNLKNKKKE